MRARLEERDGYRMVVGGPVPRHADAITVGSTISVRHESAESEWLIAHELVHVRQYAELGKVRFLVRYVRSYLRLRLAGYGHMAAYRRIPLEVEASWLSRLHGRGALEPHSVGQVPVEVSQARAPRLASTQLLHDRVQERAEELVKGPR